MSVCMIFLLEAPLTECHPPWERAPSAGRGDRPRPRPKPRIARGPVTAGEEELLAVGRPLRTIVEAVKDGIGFLVDTLKTHKARPTETVWVRTASHVQSGDHAAKRTFVTRPCHLRSSVLFQRRG